MAQVRYTRNLFLRGICIVYLFAFLSFYIQIPGLYGDNGILPVRTQVRNSTQDLTGSSILLKKSPCAWLASYMGLSDDYMLDLLSLFGAILSFAGFVKQKYCIMPIFVILWTLYYSLYQIGQEFMWFEWDVLLLEIGFLCILIAPLRYLYRGKLSTPSDAVTFWTVRWLLFRLMFASGVTKFTSECPVWWKLDALNIYFESQYIPTSLAWYAHHLPTWFLRFTTVATNIIELAVPFLFFFPNRKVRIIAFYLQVFLQVCIIVTGNYNFLNFLTICLCISLLDDQFFYEQKSKNSASRTTNYFSTLICILVYGGVIYGTYIYYNLKITDKWTIHSDIAFTQEQFDYVLSHAVPISIIIGIASLGLTIANSLFSMKEMHNEITTTIVTFFYTLAVCCMFAISLVPYSTLHNITLPMQLRKIHAQMNHLPLVNSYQQFRCMTGVMGRPEVIIEGSDSIDGPWKEYEFMYKPGNVNNLLPFVVPHQPRLDWQMWFAASGTYRQNPWLMSLAYRLLNGQPEVLALMNTVKNPFRDRPPKYIRANLYYYHYTPWNQTSNTHAWWTREIVGEYFPILYRDHPLLIKYLTKVKILQEKPTVKTTDQTLKIILDSCRILVKEIEPSLFLWTIFAAGLMIIVTTATVQ